MAREKENVKRDRDEHSDRGSRREQRSENGGQQQPNQRPLDTGGLLDPTSPSSQPIGPDVDDNIEDIGGDIEGPPIEHGTRRSRNDR